MAYQVRFTLPRTAKAFDVFGDGSVVINPTGATSWGNDFTCEFSTEDVDQLARIAYRVINAGVLELSIDKDGWRQKQLKRQWCESNGITVEASNE